MGTCSKDPIGFEGSEWNLYQYVNSNPARYLDPSGLECFDMMCTDPTGRTSPPKPKQPKPVLPPGPSTIVICASGVCTIITTDLYIPDPSDACPPKWVCYAVGGAIAGGIICMVGGEDIPWEKIRDLYERLKSLRVMEDYFNKKAQEAVQGGDMATYQYYLDRMAEIAEEIAAIADELEMLGG